jgi:hypothetical protein
VTELRYDVVKARPDAGDPLTHPDRLVVDTRRQQVVAIVYDPTLAELARHAFESHDLYAGERVAFLGPHEVGTPSPVTINASAPHTVTITARSSTGDVVTVDLIANEVYAVAGVLNGWMYNRPT